ncbi:Fe2OG dioxygenase domain-containing protein [Pseudozyma hubeiensis]|nr:Fe2OG dioxygenase domain-containing protein [Pseudozyma hubeiensis]
MLYEPDSTFTSTSTTLYWASIGLKRFALTSMARSSTSFAPTPPVSAQAEPTSSGSTSPTKRTFQSTLFNVKFGAQRTKLPATKTDATIAKRTLSQATTADEGEHPEKRSRPDLKAPTSTPSAAPQYHHRGPFHQVTRSDFCNAYKVSDLPDAEIYYKPDFIDRSLAEEWRSQLDKLPEWYRPKLKVYGREITQSREIAAYATAPGLHLKYSGHPVELHSPFPPLLNHIASLLSSDDCLGEGVKFNHCMLNRYDDGSVYIGKHSDNIENKVIVTVSLGADRSWIMQRKTPRNKAGKQGVKEEEVVKKRWTLAGGSLLVMQGQTQKFYTHEIPKELKVKGPRISITFRQLVYDQ